MNEKGSFEAPHELTVPVTVSYDDPTVQFTVETSEAVITAPVITRSAPDEDGYATYTVTYVESFHDVMHSDREKLGKGGFACADYYLYDLYTGYLIQAWNFMDEEFKESDLTTNVTYNGVTFPVEFQLISEMPVKRSENEEEDGGFKRTHVAEISAAMLIRVPQEYDGLAIGINYVDAPEFTRESVAEVETWYENEDPSHWTFIRLDDYLSE